jgi:hypothetical protein
LEKRKKLNKKKKREEIKKRKGFSTGVQEKVIQDSGVNLEESIARDKAVEKFSKRKKQI